MESKPDGSEEHSFPSPHAVTHENPDSSAAEASASASHDGRRSSPINLSTRIGPPGTVGFQFADTHGGESPVENANARLRQKFKRVNLQILSIEGITWGKRQLIMFARRIEFKRDRFCIRAVSLQSRGWTIERWMSRDSIRLPR